MHPINCGYGVTMTRPKPAPPKHGDTKIERQGGGATLMVYIFGEWQHVLTIDRHSTIKLAGSIEDLAAQINKVALALKEHFEEAGDE